MKILHVTAEYFPYIKAGGLADMVASLSKAQADEHSVYVALPLVKNLGKEPNWTGKTYTCYDPNGLSAISSASKHLREAQFREAKEGNCLLYFFESPFFSSKEFIYETGEEQYHFALFSYACHFLAEQVRADVLHAHDWHTAITVALQLYNPKPIPSVFTIHNLAYQGDFPYWKVGFLTEEPFHLVPSAFDHDGKCNFLKAGIVACDQLTTVSPGYKIETLQEPGGFGLSYILQKKGNRYLGILNGIDSDVWNPNSDPYLKTKFSSHNWKQGKTAAKKELYSKIGRPQISLNRPLLGLIGRLTYQKGYPSYVRAYQERRHLPFFHLALGAGDSELEQTFFHLSHTEPEQFYFYRGYSEELSHLIEAASDFFLMPSLFEPCGLNQMYSQVYGTVPIVSRVGGLKDTVFESGIHAQTGFVFEPNDSDSLGYALERAHTLYLSDKHDIVVKNMMSLDWSWTSPKKQYIQIYQNAISEKI